MESLFKTLDPLHTLVISCLPDAMYSHGHQVVLEPECMSMLLGELRTMAEGRLCGDRVLNTLVIDNISMFFWEVEALTPDNYKEFGYEKPLTRPRIYAELNKLINVLKQMYKCNVIVTSYDTQFERGFNQEHTNTTRGSLEAFLLLPVPFIMSNDIIIHSKNGTYLQIDKRNGKMKEYSKE